MKGIKLAFGIVLLIIFIQYLYQEINKVTNQEPQSSINQRRAMGQ